MWDTAEHFAWGKTEHIFNPLLPIQLSWNFAGARSCDDNTNVFKKNGRGEKITQSSIDLKSVCNHKSRQFNRYATAYNPK